MKKIVLLGSTGSIGVNTLNVIENLSDEFRAVTLTANTNVQLLAEQALKYKPNKVIIADESKYSELKQLLKNTDIEIEAGYDAVVNSASTENAEIVVNALVGSAGLKPTVEAAKAGKIIALANKESLVMAGDEVNRICKENGATLRPIDSEHSAIFQALLGENRKNISKIYLTASGGPFRNREEAFDNITPEQALKHPNWDMGKKISIDSATMMNKGLELIEAVHLFDVSPDDIQIVVHPESVIHSMVQFSDMSIMAQLGIPDMRIPIQFALTYPERRDLVLPELNFFKLQNMNFYKPDFDKFPCLRLAVDAIKKKGTYPVVLNAVNEIMVYRFLDGKIKFTDIPKIIEKELSEHKNIENPTIEQILDLNKEIWQRLQ